MKLLIVDDNESMRQLLKMALQNENYDVDTADNAQLATLMMDNQEYDWLISDIRMEEMDGIELAKKTKANYPKTKIILMTAFEVPERIKEVSVEGFLEKPIQIEDLCTIMRKHKKN